MTSGHLKGVCTFCGGRLRGTVAPADARQRLRMFSNLGRFHKFELLQELADCLLDDGRLPEVVEDPDDEEEGGD